MNTSIPMMGRGPDILGAIDSGNMAAARQNQFMRENALAQLYQDQGAQIAAGDQNALNALARFDPTAAIGVQDARLGMDAKRQSMQATQQRMDMLNREEARAVEEYKRGLSAQQAQAEAQKIEDAVKMGLSVQTPQEWDAMMGSVAPDLVGQFGQREALANRYMSIAEILKGREPVDPTKGAPNGYMWRDPGNPQAGVTRIEGFEQKPADDYQRYQQEETAAGRTPLSRLEFEQAKKGKGFTTTVTNADGTTTTISMGGPAGSGEPTVGEVYNPNEVTGVLSLIDSIMNDPNLSRVTGPLEGGGGNSIDDLGAVRRAWYGPEGTALVEKIGQLQGNTWLSARQMLKGGGPITDYESRKAEEAVARLSRAKGQGEFIAALQELRGAISDGMKKLQQSGGGQPSGQVSAPDFSQMSDEELDAFISGGGQ